MIGDVLNSSKMLILAITDRTQRGRVTYFEFVFENNRRKYDCASLEEKVGANWDVTVHADFFLSQ